MNPLADNQQLLEDFARDSPRGDGAGGFEVGFGRWFCLRIYRVLLGFVGFYWVLLGFIGFCWVLLGFIRFYGVFGFA